MITFLKKNSLNNSMSKSSHDLIRTENLGILVRLITEFIRSVQRIKLHHFLTNQKDLKPALLLNQFGYDDDALDPSEEYWKKQNPDEEDQPYFPPEESKPPHY